MGVKKRHGLYRVVCDWCRTTSGPEADSLPGATSAAEAAGLKRYRQGCSTYSWMCGPCQEKYADMEGVEEDQ